MLQNSKMSNFQALYLEILGFLSWRFETFEMQRKLTKASESRGLSFRGKVIGRSVIGFSDEQLIVDNSMDSSWSRFFGCSLIVEWGGFVMDELISHKDEIGRW